MCPINDLGYGQVGTNLTRELSKICNLSLFPIGQATVNTFEDHRAIEQCVKNARTPDFDAPCIRIWHQHDMSQFVGYGEKIGFPIFELDNFSDQEKHHLNRGVDKLFVCSDWAKNIINRETQVKRDRTNVCPLGVAQYETKIELSKSPTTKFFTCGKWEVRKGHDKIIEAFCQAFNEDDEVMLYMMCNNPFLNYEQEKQWLDLYCNSKMGHKVRFLPRVKTHKEVIDIMSEMDCGIFISRAEGWNLELLEMMSCGKPVIATAYSAHLQFCTSLNSMLVGIDQLEPAYDGFWFDGKSGNWAHLGERQINQIALYMKEVHREKFINEAGIETAKKFTWENSARKVLENVTNF